MTIYDPNPAARIRDLSDALAPVADKLRQKGATVEFLDQQNHDIHAIVMTVAMRFPLPEAVAATTQLKEFAKRSGGTAYGTLLTGEKTGVPEGEYRVAVLYQVSKPPHVRKRRRAA